MKNKEKSEKKPADGHYAFIWKELGRGSSFTHDICTFCME